MSTHETALDPKITELRQSLTPEALEQLPHIRNYHDEHANPEDLEEILIWPIRRDVYVLNSLPDDAYESITKPVIFRPEIEVRLREESVAVQAMAAYMKDRGHRNSASSRAYRTCRNVAAIMLDYRE